MKTTMIGKHIEDIKATFNMPSGDELKVTFATARKTSVNGKGRSSCYTVNEARVIVPGFKGGCAYTTPVKYWPALQQELEGDGYTFVPLVS